MVYLICSNDYLGRGRSQYEQYVCLQSYRFFYSFFLIGALANGDHRDRHQTLEVTTLITLGNNSAKADPHIHYWPFDSNGRLVCCNVRESLQNAALLPHGKDFPKSDEPSQSLATTSTPHRISIFELSSTRNTKEVRFESVKVTTALVEDE